MAISVGISTAQHRVAVKPSRYDDQPNRLARHRQVRQSTPIPAVDPL